MTPTGTEGRMETIDAMLWLAAGAVFTAGVVVGAGVALAVGLMVDAGRTSRWEERRHEQA